MSNSYNQNFYQRALTVIPPQQNSRIICKADSGATKTYLKPTDRHILQNIYTVLNGPSVDIPNGEKVVSRFTEFFEQQTVESKFARAIEQFDAQIQELDCKEDWKGWTEDFFVEKIGPWMKPFPELQEAFIELTEYLREHNYFDTSVKIKESFNE